MTVHDMDRRMGHDEFVEWHIWHARKAQRQELAAKMAKHGG